MATVHKSHNEFRTRLACCLLVFFSSELSASPEIKLSSSATPISAIFDKIRQPFEDATKIKIVYIGKRGESGFPAEVVMQDVERGTADAGAGALSWFEWQDLMQEKKLEANRGGNIRYKLIGRDRVSVFAHKSVPSKLSQGQLRSLFTGKITNYKDFGGPDLKIVPVYHTKLTSTMRLFRQKMMLSDPYFMGPPAIILLESLPAKELTKVIGKTPGAIGFGSRDLIDKSVKSVDVDTIGRPITFIWKGDPSTEILKLLEFIEKEGAKHGVDQ